MTTTRREMLQAGAARPARALRRLSGRLAAGVRRFSTLRGGVPAAFVAALAAVVLALILYTVASRDSPALRGYAEFTMFRNGCAVEPLARQGVQACFRARPGVYAVVFTRSLAGGTAVATRGTCCPGPISASITADRVVTVVVPRRVRNPIRASVLVP